MYRDACLQADNFAAALAWSFEQGETEPGLRLCTALRSPWVTDGDVADGANWLDQFLNQHSLSQQSLNQHGPGQHMRKLGGSAAGRERSGQCSGGHRLSPACTRGLGTASTAARSREESG